MAKRATLPVLIAFLAAGAVAAWGSGGEASLLQADQLYDRWDGSFDFDAYQADLTQAIGLYEQTLMLLPETAVQTRGYVLARLSRACFELANTYVTDRDDDYELYKSGTEYGLAALRLDPAFVEQEKQGFRSALETATNLEALFWYGNCLGKYIEFDLLRALNGGSLDVRAAFTRTYELDPTYLDGGPIRSLGSFLTQAPGLFGGDAARGEELLAEVVTAAPDFVENWVNYADFVSRPDKDWETYCSYLQEALTRAQSEAAARWPMYNALAQRRALELLDQHPCD